MTTRGEVGYMQAHLRVKNIKGRAANYSCVDCGKVAKHWSYNGSDPDECVEGKLTYSLNMEYYVPRCVHCHSRHDKTGDVGIQSAPSHKSKGWYVVIRWGTGNYIYRPFFTSLDKARECRDRFLYLDGVPERDTLVDIAKEIRNSPSNIDWNSETM